MRFALYVLFYTFYVCFSIFHESSTGSKFIRSVNAKMRVRMMYNVQNGADYENTIRLFSVCWRDRVYIYMGICVRLAMGLDRLHREWICSNSVQ